MAGRRRERVYKVLVDEPTEDKMKRSFECVSELNLKTTDNVMDQQQLLVTIQNLRKELSISKENNDILRVQFKRSCEELAMKENEINSLCNRLSDVESKCETAISAAKELQDGQEKTKAKVDVKERGEQVAVPHQSLHTQTEDREKKAASSDLGVVKEKLEKEVSQMTQLLEKKELQLNRANKRAKAHRATLYKFDETQKALEEELNRQLKERDEREESFKKELSEQEARFKKVLSGTEQSLKQRLHEKEESFQREVSAMKELSEICASRDIRLQHLEEETRKLEDYFQMKENIHHSVEVKIKEELQRLKEEHTQLQETLEECKMKCCALEELSKQLLQRDEQHVRELSVKEEIFRKELMDQEARFQSELSDKEEMFQKELSAMKKLSEFCAHSHDGLERSKLKHCGLEENLSKQLAERDERHLQELSKREENFRAEMLEQETRFQKELCEKGLSYQKKLSEKDKMLQKKIFEKDRMFQKKFTEKVESFQKKVSDMKKVSEMWESRAQQLEDEKRELEDILQTKENTQHTVDMKKKKKKDFQPIKEEGPHQQREAAVGVDKLQNRTGSGLNDRHKNVSSRQPEDRAMCSICRSEPTDPISRPCGHTFCKKCITELMKKRKTCPSCKGTNGKRKGFKCRIAKLFHL